MRTTIAALLLAATAFGCSPPDGEPAPTPTSRPRRERVRVKSVPARSAPVAEPSADIPRPVPHVTAPSTEIAPQTAGTDQPEATQPPEQAEPEAPVPASVETSTPDEPWTPERLREKYEDAKGGRLFGNDAYWVDSGRPGAAGWRRVDAEGGNESEPQFLVLHVVWHPSDESTSDPDPEAAGEPDTAFDAASDPDAEHRIEIVVWRYLHVTTSEDGSRAANSVAFSHTGETVANSDAEGLCDAWRKNWMAMARELDADATVPVMKKKLGVVKFFAAAAGREPESDLRVRKEWLAWINGKRGETYIVTITYGSEVMGEAERAHALVGAIDAVREAAKRDSGR